MEIPSETDRPTGGRATLRAAALAFGLSLAWLGGVAAAPISDPLGDFLPTYTAGPKGGDLDVLAADAVYTGTSFILSGTEAGPIGTTPGALFVWGIDRGRGTARFGALAPGVTFDSVVSINPAGTTRVTDLISGLGTDLPSSAVTVSGSSLSIIVPAGLLPAFPGLLRPDGYLVNLWPRLGAGNNNQIADFAPDNSDFQVRAVPEPTSVALLLSGLVGLTAVRGWHRRHRQPRGGATAWKA